MTDFVVGESVRIRSGEIGRVKEIIFYPNLPYIPLYVISVDQKEMRHFDWQLKKVINIEEDKNFKKLFE